ncbi:PAS domain S-box protein, partial [Thermodesulfobacteriota bacterium]
ARKKSSGSSSRLRLFFGYTKEEMLGMKISSIYADPSDRKAFVKEMHRTGSVKDYGIKFRKKDGTEVDARLTAIIRRSHDGTPVGFQGVIRDVTEYKRAQDELQRAHDLLEERVALRTADLPQANEKLSEEIAERRLTEQALRQSESRYRTLFEQSRDAIIILTPSGEFVDVNRSFLDLIGYSREEIMATNASTLWAIPAERSKWVERMGRRGSAKDYEWQVRRKDGVVRNCLMTSSVRRARNGSLQYQTIIRDVTEQKEAAEALVTAHDVIEERVKQRTEELVEANRQLNKEIRERRGAEAALRQGTTFMESALDTLTDALVVLDFNGNFSRWNTAVSNITGYSSQEIARMKVTDFFSGEEIPRINEAIGKALREGHAELEAGVTRKDGEQVAFEFTGDLLRDPQGNPTSVCVVARDVAERKQAQEALRESEARYREVVQKANSVILRMDCLGNVTFINEFARRFFGFEGPEILGRNVVGTIVPERESSGRDLAAMIQDIGRHPERHEYKENENMRSDGERVWIAWTNRGITDETGRVVEVLCIGNDITGSKLSHERLREEHDEMERQVSQRIADLRETDKRLRKEIEERELVEQALQGTEERYRALFHGSSDGIFITTKDGRIIEANQSFLNLVEYTPDEMTGTKAGDLHSDPADHEALVKELLATGSVKDYEVRLRRQDGTNLECLMTGSLERSEARVIVGYHGILRDVTEQRRLEQQLLQSHKMEAMGTLAAGIAHDFNNILFVITGFTELALDDIPEDNPTRPLMERVLTASTRAGDLVNQILTFSRQTEESREPIEITPIVKEVAKFLRASIPSTIQIRQNIGANIPPILSHPTKIHQVLMNLCTNSAQAIPETGGTLTINLKMADLTLRDVPPGSNLAPGAYAKLTVTDTGHGMTPDVLERIFEPYYTTKEPGSGTGLGLAVVHGIVAAHGGTITAESQPGKGSTFCVYLPITRGESGERTASGESESMPTGQERVLLVDDEAELLNIGTLMLEGLGYQVEQRLNGVDALGLFRRKPDHFDLVITDMTMPKMTGYSLAKDLLAIRPDIPIMLCTGFSEQVTEEQAKTLGMRAPLIKPVRREDLARTVRRVLDSPKESEG